MLKTLLKYKISLQSAKQNYEDNICFEFQEDQYGAELFTVITDTSAIDVKMKVITNEVVKHEFINEYESFMMKTTLQPLTALELFIKKTLI